MMFNSHKDLGANMKFNSLKDLEVLMKSNLFKDSAVKESKETKVSKVTETKEATEGDDSTLLRLKDFENEDEYVEPIDFESPATVATSEYFSPEGKLFLMYSATRDGYVGLSRYGEHRRLPYHNFPDLIGRIAHGGVVIMGGNAYRSLLSNGITFAYGATTVVLTRDDNLVQDENVIRFSNIEELKRHIAVTKQFSNLKMFVNAGPTLLKEFEPDADGEYVLTTGVLRDYSQKGDKFHHYRSIRKIDNDGSILLHKGPIKGVTRKDINLAYRKFESYPNYPDIEIEL